MYLDKTRSTVQLRWLRAVRRNIDFTALSAYDQRYWISPHEAHVPQPQLYWIQHYWIHQMRLLCLSPSSRT